MGFLLMWAELPGSFPDHNILMIKQDNLGRVTAAKDSIQDLVSRETDYMDGVLESSTDVRESPEDIHLHCRLSVDAAANVFELGQQVQERIKGAVEHFLGKPIAGVHIQAQLAHLEKNKKKMRSRVR